MFFSSIHPAKPEGLRYIQQQEKLPTQPLATKFSKEKEENITDENVFARFHDYVFLGDSRVLGFQSYGFLEDSRVLADTGDSIVKIDAHLETIKKISPTSVYISYGLNDLGRNYEGGYVAKVQEEVKKVQVIVPQAKIYICAIIPVNQALTQNDARWQQIPTINQALKKMCKKQKWIYVADDTLANESIYAQDGMHFQPSFYQTWAETILDTRK
ncbi:GDSL-type esterase/lipase family protein [Absicoccus sp.]|uniref:GDSL-type esterase/lipase family protein n=1 Tax=Absicoccus sp. TaxID=2718527 RepID=UPI002A74CF4D|nr:GDSL-type esterase/lipase family protein [Absicoccus sp.]